MSRPRCSACRRELACGSWSCRSRWLFDGDWCADRDSTDVAAKWRQEDREAGAFDKPFQGFVVELAYARDDADLERAAQAYRDFRTLFGSSMLLPIVEEEPR